MTATKTNLYWSAYKNLEKEVLDLSFKISFDNTNLDNKTHSMGIADLILRSASYIESISKDLYFTNGGTGDRDKVAYDHDCIYKLLTDWSLQKREVLLGIPTHNLTKKEYLTFKPFDYSGTKEWRKKKRPIYSWNEAYQALKHDLLESIPEYATIYNLLSVMATLFLLNVYYKNKKEQVRPANMMESMEYFGPRRFAYDSSLFYIEGVYVKSD